MTKIKILKKTAYRKINFFIVYLQKYGKTVNYL